MTLAAIGTLTARSASAEEPAPATPPAATTVAQAEAAPPAPPPPAPPTPPPATTPPPAVATTPPIASETMPASREEKLPPITVGAWTRVGGMFQSGSDPASVGDWRMDAAYVELHAGGKIHKNVGVTLNLNGNMTGWDPVTGVPTPGSMVAIMDAIIQLDLADEFHVWAGHLLVPVDRANASGPFFMIPWRYPGFLSVGPTTVVAAPMEGPYGRNNGAVVWGDVLNNKLTYLAGVFDNANVAASPLFSGRLRLALWDTEPGFWGNASFFGDKDILSVGLGGQYMKDGAAMGTAWSDVNLDLLVEKKLGGGSFVTGEGAYYHFGGVDGMVSDTFYLLAAYATPTIGVGSIQPMARYQWAKIRGPGDAAAWNLDAAVSYLIKGPALRLIGTFSHTNLPGDITGNAVHLSGQAIFF
jgi:hypothetical protein